MRPSEFNLKLCSFAIVLALRICVHVKTQKGLLLSSNLVVSIMTVDHALVLVLYSSFGHLKITSVARQCPNSDQSVDKEKK